MPATMNAGTTDGPERSAIAAAVRTKMPAPMMPPMPSITSDDAPSVRLRACSPVASASAISRSIDLVRKSDPAMAAILRESLEVRTNAFLRLARAQQVADHGHG